PFVNALTGAEAAQRVSSPGTLTGVVTVHTNSDVYGGEANLVGCLMRDDLVYWDAFAGFRYQGLRETLQIGSTSGILSGSASFAGTTVSSPGLISVVDHFDTRNNFYGGQIGTRFELYRGNAFVNVLGKLALGSNHESVNITGSSSANTPSGVTTVPGGL